MARAGEGDLAASALERALEELPRDPELLRAAAAIDRRRGRWAEASERLRRALRHDPLDLELAAELVRTLALVRELDLAAEQAERLAARFPEATEPALWRADLLLRGRGDTAGARALLEELPQAARAGPRWQESMLRLELYEGEYAAALERLPALELEEAEALVERAWIHRHMGRARRAAADFERARDLLDDRLEAAPDDPWPRPTAAPAGRTWATAWASARWPSCRSPPTRWPAPSWWSGWRGPTC